ncbi:MAG: ABC transporter permease [Alkaliphilus sp.]|nr:ABC transporter permease [bacterium AH-315-G05]PHS35785.1 MAG: ABC transporter permease [Alkaliphilus sp.]
MIEKKELMEKTKRFFVGNMVTIVFVALGILGFIYSGLSLPFFVNELFIRITRNSLLVLALIIPVLAGMGLNFAIVLGAMAGQVAIIVVTHWGIVGVKGFLLCMLLAVPVALIFGYLTGSLLNKTKGKEMIASLILGFFANGLYQLVFLIFIGTIIPMQNEVLVLSSGVGLRVTIDLTGGIKYAIDHIWRLTIPWAALSTSILTMLYISIKFYLSKTRKTIKQMTTAHLYYFSAAMLLALWSIYIMNTDSLFNMLRVPIITVLAILLVCLFTVFIMKTKLGQDLKTVGQDRHIATVAGINSNKVRLTAIMISTVLAAWGQLFFLQNLGTMSTYGSHEQVGMFSIAALLIGGASVSKATIGQALLGVVLFHTLFIVSPLAGRNVFGDAQLGEFFRAFVAYGVIGLSLGMHAWKKQIQARNSLKG